MAIDDLVPGAIVGQTLKSGFRPHSR